MKKRRSLTKREQVQTLEQFLRDKRWTQIAFVRWLESKGVLISAQYVNDVICHRRDPGPKLIAVLKQITGIRLVEGLVEDMARSPKKEVPHE